jgi:hypothetical protein
MPSMTYKEGWLIFKAYAERRGYKQKQVGDLAFINKKGQVMRLKSVKANIIAIYQEGIGYYTI